jgi:hypothetical protein
MRIQVLTGIIAACTFLSCRKDAVPDTDYPFVVMEDFTDITSTGATFNARIANTGTQRVMDYGFVWTSGEEKPSLNNAFVSLGKNIGEGSFSSRVQNDLRANFKIQVRAYVKTEKMVVYSNTRSFLSVGCSSPVIETVYPDSGTTGKLITITGDYFSSDPKGNTVLFGSSTGSVIRSTSDTIFVKCPVTENTVSVKISVETGGKQVYDEGSFKLMAPFTRLSNNFDIYRPSGTSFTVNSKGYVCLGETSSKNMWEYDLNTNQWTGKAMFPASSRRVPIGFAIGNKGYVGLGHDGVSTMFKDLWEYDPVADSWTRMADFPGDLRMYMPFYRYFVLNNKLYMYVTSENQFWEFDPSLDSWRKLPNNDAFTGKLIEHGFSCKGKGYFLMWTNEYSLWEYKPLENSLTNLGTISKNPAFDSFILEDRLYLTLDNHRILEYDFSDKSSFSYYWNEDGYCWYIFTLGEKAWMGASVNYLFYPH